MCHICFYIQNGKKYQQLEAEAENRADRVSTSDGMDVGQCGKWYTHAGRRQPTHHAVSNVSSRLVQLLTRRSPFSIILCNNL